MYVYVFLVSYIKKKEALRKRTPFRTRTQRPHAAPALARPHRQPFFAHARYFFSLDSSSAEMQCAVAATLARMAAAAMCDAATIA